MAAISAGVRIGITLALEVLRVLPEDTPLDEIVTAAMKAARRQDVCFMAPTDDEKFRIGCGALLLHFKDDRAMVERIEQELEVLRMLGAAQQGIPVDFTAMHRLDEPLGLLGAFRAASGT